MKIKRIFKAPAVLLVLSAFLSALPFTFSNLFLLSWISFVPIFYTIIKDTGNKLLTAIGRGFLFGFVYHICIYYWFLWFYPLDYVNLTSASSVFVIALAWIGISVVHGVLWCIPFVCCHFVKKVVNRPMFLSLLTIVGIISAQKITQLGELSFPWTRVSLGQYKAPALIQSASLWGAEGLDIVILVFNALIALAIISPRKKRIVASVLAAVVFLANLGFGIIKLNTTCNCNEITIMTAQASVPQDEKWASDGDTICLEVYTKLTKENISEGVDLIIWPESAVPRVYKSEKSLKPYLKLSEAFDTPVLAGIILKTGKFNTNNTLLINQDGLQATYTKRQMVPFGEYMPYAKILSRLFPTLTSLNIIEDDYVAGNSSAVMEIAGGKVGNIICFESIYPTLTRQSVQDGAQLMVEATNDSWLKDSPAMYQHLSHGVFRSVENGRYLVRSANSGISAVIDNHGNIKQQLGINEQGTITDTVQLCAKQTIYTKTGNVLFPACCALVLIWFIMLIIKKIKASV